MKNIICIGECALNVVFKGSVPVGAIPGGRIAAAAALMGRKQLPVVMASEAAADPVGDIVVGSLTDAGVDVSSLDRFTEGHTPMLVFTETSDTPGDYAMTRYEDYADESFDIVWPRVGQGSVVIFGGYYALDRRMRTRLVPFLNHCAEMGAVMIYLPGFMAPQERRITRVMPAILENLEIAHLTITRNNDLRLIFGTDAGSKCYTDHIDFYCRSLINVDTACRSLDFFSGHEVTKLEIPERICETMMWNAGVVAGVAAEIFDKEIKPEALDAPGEDLRKQLLTVAALSAQQAASTLTDDWQKIIKD